MPSKEIVGKNTAISGQVEREVSALVIAFTQGAKWWEWYKSEFTRQSDQELAEEAALERARNGTLGVLPEFRMRTNN